MAQNNNNGGKVTLLTKLTFAPELRGEDTPYPVIEGRFRYFFALFKRRNSNMILTNLLFLITALPLIAIILFPTFFGGMEGFAYLLDGTKDLPYFMQNVGFGMSSGTSVLTGQLQILNAYMIYFLCIAASLIFLSVGLAGVLHVSMKFVWQDKFVSKKDSYGNDVPKVVKEFFIGIKKHALQMFIVCFVIALVFGGVTTSIVYFLQQFRQGLAGAGEWILIFVACIIGLLVAMISMFLLPMIVEYDIPLLKKVKNAVILMLSMFLPTLFMLAICAVPFLLFALTSGFISIIVAALLIVFGSTFYGLLLSNYMQYHAEKIITPVYESQRQGKKKKKKNKK